VPGHVEDIAKKIYEEVIAANGSDPQPKNKVIEEVSRRLQEIDPQTVLSDWLRNGAKKAASDAGKKSLRRTTEVIKDAHQLKFPFVAENPDAMSIEVSGDVVGFRQSDPNLLREKDVEHIRKGEQKIEGIQKGMVEHTQGTARFLRAIDRVGGNSVGDLVDDEGKIRLEAEKTDAEGKDD